MHKEGGSLPLARKMRRLDLQSHIHKFAAGKVKAPRMSTAMPLAKFLKLPVEAIFDEAVASRYAKEHGITALPAENASLKVEAKEEKSAEDREVDAFAKQYRQMNAGERHRLRLLMMVARDAAENPAENWRAPGRPSKWPAPDDSGLTGLDEVPPSPKQRKGRSK